MSLGDAEAQQDASNENGSGAELVSHACAACGASAVHAVNAPKCWVHDQVRAAKDDHGVARDRDAHCHANGSPLCSGWLMTATKRAMRLNAGRI